MNIFRRIWCKIVGHKINQFLVETSREKDCIRCGKKITVWWIVTYDDAIHDNL